MSNSYQITGNPTRLDLDGIVPDLGGMQILKGCKHCEQTYTSLLSIRSLIQKAIDATPTATAYIHLDHALKQINAALEK